MTPTIIHDLQDRFVNYTLSFILLSLGVYVTFTAIYWIREKKQWHFIPPVGCNGPLSSLRSAFKFDTLAKNMVTEGCIKYPNGLFRIPMMNGWHVILTRRDYIEELRKAPEELASLDIILEETFGTHYLLTPSLTSNPYHAHIIRGQLSNSKILNTIFQEIHDELMVAFDYELLNVNDWTTIPAYSTALQIIARTTTRILVGKSLSHNPEFVDGVLKCTIDVINGSRTLGIFPSFLKPLAAKYLTNVPKSVEDTSRHLEPIIKERKEKIALYGKDYPDKPLDFLSWLLDEAKGEEQDVRALTLRILFVSFAAVHTTSMAFTHTLYYLASHPDYLSPLREEIESVIEDEGWSRNSINRMAKLDSFLKESLRLNKTHATAIHRKLRTDFVFSDGARIPQGTIVSVAERPAHGNRVILPDLEHFDGFRFVNQTSQNINQFVSTSLDYLPFGHGRRSCPGRFFAGDELKAIMAYLVLNYDVQMKIKGTRPPNIWIGLTCMPNPFAEVMIRRRKRSI